MKQDIHPITHPVVFVDTSSGEEFVTTSTLKSEETKQINGVDHYVIRIEISSSSHPFYTGQDRFVDTAGRVDKFKEKMERAAEVAGTRGTKKAKKAAALAAEEAEAAAKAKAERKAKKAKETTTADTSGDDEGTPVEVNEPIEQTEIPTEEPTVTEEKTDENA